MSILSSIPYYTTISFVLDFILVFYLTFKLLTWLKRSHALDLMKGVFLIVAVFLLSHVLDLKTLNWILEKFATVLIILVFIIFQPELRRFLERVGSSDQLFSLYPSNKTSQSATFIQIIIKAVDYLAKEKMGALIVLERKTALDEFIETGVTINADLNAELLISLFWPGTPTHDGAVIINESSIKASGCFLRLTDSPISDRRLGTRHRAALGLSEVSDALIIVVSEEKGVISFVEQGNMTRFLTKEALETRLFSLLSTKDGISGTKKSKKFAKKG